MHTVGALLTSDQPTWIGTVSAGSDVCPALSDTANAERNDQEWKCGRGRNSVFRLGRRDGGNFAPELL
jgi:hypothetical protein